MKKKLIFVLIAMVLSSCATNPKKNTIAYIDKPKADCIRIGDLSSYGFSLIPPVASAVAKSILEEKAADYNVNSIRLDEEKGIFQVEMKATGYRCAEVAEVSKKPAGKK